MIIAMKKEIVLQKPYLNEPVETIYFGGGTPSILTASEIESLIDLIFENYEVALKECTLEANPDDLTPQYLSQLAQTKIDRLSIGIQSFDDDVLKWMNRSHNSLTAVQSVENAAKAGFEKISIDLIYAVPETTNIDWEKNLRLALQLPINHLSAYCLTAEEKTVYGKLVSQKKISEAEHELAQQQFLMLVEIAGQHQFEQYEISNFCKNETYAIHNSSYWKNKPYLGIGPSAHSYNGNSRQWNVKNNFSYIKAIKEGCSFFEKEILTPTEKINEYLMTSLRTKWGANMNHIKECTTSDQFDEFKKVVAMDLEKGLLQLNKDILTIPAPQKFIADNIISDLFIE